MRGVEEVVYRFAQRNYVYKQESDEGERMVIELRGRWVMEMKRGWVGWDVGARVCIYIYDSCIGTAGERAVMITYMYIYKAIS